MKKLAFAALAVGLLAAALWLLVPRLTGTPPCGPEPPLPLETAPFTIVSSSGPVELTVEVADEPQEHATGLMCRESLDPGAGMLFVFSSERIRSFWMKSTLIPLDAIFLDGDLTVVDIVEGAVPCEGDLCPLYTSTAPALYALEVNAGFVQDHGIRIGDVAVLA